MMLKTYSSAYCESRINPETMETKKNIKKPPACDTTKKQTLSDFFHPIERYIPQIPFYGGIPHFAQMIRVA